MSPIIPIFTPSKLAITTSNEVLLKSLEILNLTSLITGLGNLIRQRLIIFRALFCSLEVGIGVYQVIPLLLYERYSKRGLPQPAIVLRPCWPLVKVLVLLLTLPF